MPGGTFLKICGTTNVRDADLIGKSGADYCGILVEVSFSERSLSLSQARQVALASSIPNVILLCDPEMELVERVIAEINPYAIQLQCRESPEFLKEVKTRFKNRVWKTVHLPILAGQASPQEYAKAGADALLVDNLDTSEGFQRMGGTGKVADWKAAEELVRTVDLPVFLAGGINPANVARAVDEVRPYGIDLCSGVEASKGSKDPEKINKLVKNFKTAVEKLGRGNE
jgi:phosphoribosylanthranilate isomerase